MREDRIKAAIWGVLVGDALGLPHQFKGPTLGNIEMVYPPSYSKTYPKIPYGTWSDDGALTLALAASLTACRGFNMNDYAARMIEWFLKGAYTVDGKAYDVGNTTQEAILRMVRGSSPAEAGLSTESNNGNGSLMRVLPLALCHRGTDEELMRDAMESSRITHAHAWSMLACGIYAVAARVVLDGGSPDEGFIRGIRSAGTSLPFPTSPSGSGFVLDTLIFTIQAARSKWSYEQTMFTALALGNDTDTTAAVAGGFLALRDGLDAIPMRWLDAMRGREKAEAIIEPFVAFCKETL